MQAEDRVHRIGQRDSVEIHYLLASGTVDEQLWSLVKNKLDVLSQVGLNKESFDNISLTHVKVSFQLYAFIVYDLTINCFILISFPLA